MQCRLLKESVRTSNWESRALSYEQQLYAATDAFASLRLYQVSAHLELPFVAIATPRLSSSRHSNLVFSKTSRMTLIDICVLTSLYGRKH